MLRLHQKRKSPSFKRDSDNRKTPSPRGFSLVCPTFEFHDAASRSTADDAVAVGSLWSDWLGYNLEREVSGMTSVDTALWPVGIPEFPIPLRTFFE